MALAGMTVEARQLTPEQALVRVTADQQPGMMYSAAAQRPQLAYSVEHDQQPRAYVFNTGSDGFMVVSADDCAPALLGYSDNGRFDEADMPDNLKAWLDEYARQIAWASANNLVSAAAAVKQRAEVAPKLTTLWDQGNPYYNKCPKVGSKYCVTGCVATAMAQVLNWHKWPEQPVGSVSYTCRGIGTLSIDYSTIKFEWDKMLDTYTYNSPQENKDAVATLMMACGYGANMYYSTSSSGATSYVACQAMINNFGYDRGMTLQQRQWYGIEEWADLVYDELTANGPVYYDGSGTGGGHAFVCDGYSAADGLFHFNWGWSGKSNGYYRLSALNPADQGTGGVSLGYNWDQAIIRGLKKAQPDSKPVFQFAPRGGVRCPHAGDEGVALGGYFTMLGYDTQDGFANYSLFDLEDVYFGARFDNTLSGETVYIQADNQTSGMSAKAYYPIINVIRIPVPENMPLGFYEIRPVFKVGSTGEWLSMRENPVFRNVINGRVENGRIYLSMKEAQAPISVGKISGPEYFTTNSPFSLDFVVKNTGTADFFGQVCAMFMTYDEKTNSLKLIDWGEKHELEVVAGDSVAVRYNCTATKGTLVDGEYLLGIGNNVTGELISDLYEAKVGNRYGTLHMTYLNFIMESQNYADRDRLHMTADITCSEGMYKGPFGLAVSTSRRNFKPEWVLMSDVDYELTAVESKSIDFTVVFPQAVIGETYYGILCYPDAASEGGCRLMAEYPLSFTVAESSGVNGVVAAGQSLTVSYDAAAGTVSAAGPAEVTSIRVLSAAGVLAVDAAGASADVSALSPGIYLVVASDAAGNTATSKIIR